MITVNLVTAKIKRALLARQRDSLVRKSVQLHGKLAHTSSANKRAWNAAYNAWYNCVYQVHQVEKQIAQYDAYLNNGATTASLDVAKAVGAWEGGRSSDGLFHPYWDSAGRVWTIGYGHTGDVSANSRALTIQEATTLLLHDLQSKYAPAVRSALKRYKWKVNQRMFDALTDFAYNLGPGYFNTPYSGVGYYMARRDARGTANSFLGYDHADGQVLPGLVRRRQWEKQLFLGGTYNVN